MKNQYLFTTFCVLDSDNKESANKTFDTIKPVFYLVDGTYEQILKKVMYNCASTLLIHKNQGNWSPKTVEKDIDDFVKLAMGFNKEEYKA